MTTKYKIQYELDAGMLEFPMTVFFTFSPGAPETRWQPADPDELEIVDVECELLSSEGEIEMIKALNDGWQFFDWLEAHKEEAVLL